MVRVNPFGNDDLFLFLPETFLAAGVLLLFLGEIIFSNRRTKRWTLTVLAMAALASSGTAAVALWSLKPTSAFAAQVAVDPVSCFFKIFFVVITAVAILTSLLSKELPPALLGEYLALLLSVTLGMFLMASANNLLTIYLGIELVSIVSFALAGYRLRDRRSTEAALKYVVFGGVASGVMLFGISLAYGLTGSVDLSAINRFLAAWSAGRTPASMALLGKAFPLTLTVSLLFIFAGIAYKIAAVPFHMWTPDVYEGAPTPFVGFLSVGPKAAGFALLMRVVTTVLVTAGPTGMVAGRGFAADSSGNLYSVADLPLGTLLGLIAVATMTLGNLAAIPQNNVKRLLAYSSIAHAGYILMGFVVLSESALQAVLLYLAIYFVMNIGAFTVVQAVRDRTGGETLTEFRGLSARAPALAMAMAIFLLSLTGIPPLAGFVAKFYLFAAVIQRGGFWYVILALIGVINSAISLYYYMRVVRAMYLTAPATEQPLAPHRGYLAVIYALVLAVLTLGVYWAPLSDSARQSLTFYRDKSIPDAAAIVDTHIAH
jgi:NADH-quinone oxidoreductase subunit N